MAQVIREHCPGCQRLVGAGGACSFCLLQLGKIRRRPPASQDDLDLPHPEQLQRSFPQLEITRLIGRGGMGAIYHARQRSLDRDVALKIIARSVADDPTFEERFTREAKTLAKLSHPNIVAVYDFGTTEGGLVYLLMEYVDGVNLREAMDGGDICSDEALQIVRDICAALQFAHDRGVVHRDIKPENVLLNEEGIVKVADFGLAKMVGDVPGSPTLTHTRQVMGTLRYMAPEQFENPSAVDHRADVYSLGVVFYELLTGQVPIGRFEPPSRLNPDVGPHLDEIVMRSLDRRPPSRYQRVSEIATELSSLSAGPPMPLPRAAAAPTSESLTVQFRTNLMGGLAEANGNLTLHTDQLVLEYRTRDNVFQVIKSSPATVGIPLSELSKLEWRPGVFCSTITIAPKSISLLDQLPCSDSTRARLTIARADTHNAARLVFEAARRQPSLSNHSSFSVTHQVATSAPRELGWKRIAFSILLFVCAVLNHVGMILVLIALSARADEPIVVVAIVFTPLLTLTTVVSQVVGGIFCLSPYTHKMPLAAAIISMLPLAAGWPLGLFVGAWGYWMLQRDEPGGRRGNSFDSRQDAIMQKPFVPVAPGRVQTTLLLLRESRWARVVAVGNLLALLSVALLLIGYQLGIYPTTLRYRIVDEGPWSDELERVTARLETVPVFGISREGTNFAGGKQFSVRCMKWSEPQVRTALATAGPVQWAWVVEPVREMQQQTDRITAQVGGRFTDRTLAISGDSVVLATKPNAFGLADLASISGTAQSLQLAWAPKGRATVMATRPSSRCLGLALIVEGLVEGFAPLDEVTNRGVNFLLAPGSRVDSGAVEAAIRGPELRSPLELIPMH